MPYINRINERALITLGNITRRVSGRLKIRLTTYYKVQPSGQLRGPRSTTIRGRYFYIGNNSSVTVDQDCLIEGFFHVGNNCKVRIGKHFRMTNHPSFIVDDHSVVQIGDHCVFDETKHAPASIHVSSGKLTLERNVTVRGSIKVRGGELQVGSDTFLNHGSEVRSEEKVSIGSHVLVSYFVDIFDTNTHSTDWRDRREEIDDGFPNGTVQSEKNKPETSPIYIGDDVWIGKYVAILKGVSIGARSIVGTRSVVTKSCPEDSMVVGNPAINRSLLVADSDRNNAE